MRSLLAVLLAFTFLAPDIGAAQSVTAVAPGADSTPVAAAPAGSDSCMPGMAGMAAPTGMPGMAMSPEQLKQMQAQMAAMQGNGDAQSAAAMQAMRARTAQMAGGAGMPSGAMTMSPEQLMKQMQAQMTQMGACGPGMPPGAMAMPPGGMEMAPGAIGPPGEGEGKALEVSSDLPGDLKKGKTVIRNIDWIPGGGTVSPAGADGFARAMAQVAAAMKQAGGSYRVDLYMDNQSGNIVVRTLGPQRLAAVRASLVEGGAPPGVDGPRIGHSMKDGDPRLEIIRLK